MRTIIRRKERDRGQVDPKVNTIKGTCGKCFDTMQKGEIVTLAMCTIYGETRERYVHLDCIK